MRSKLVATVLATASGVALGASAQDIKLHAAAYGNLPDSQVVDNNYLGAQWAAANYQSAAHAEALKHPFDPPFTESTANAMFDQSHADGAVLRADGVARQPYRGQGNNPNRVEAGFTLAYSMHVENLAASPLRIVLGNDLHGRFAIAGGGVVDMKEMTTVFGPGVGGIGSGSVLLTYAGLTTFGDWNNTTSPTTIHDVVYGDVNGIQMHSYGYLTQLVLGGGKGIDLDVEFDLQIYAVVTEHVGDGLAWFDFSNTGNLTTKAYDPDTNEDRSSDIRVTLVQTPTPGGAGLAMMLGGCAIRRKRRA